MSSSISSRTTSMPAMSFIVIPVMALLLYVFVVPVFMSVEPSLGSLLMSIHRHQQK